MFETMYLKLRLAIEIDSKHHHNSKELYQTSHNTAIELLLS